MYCENHDVVCCYACAAEDHKSCKDMVSVSDNVDRLYSKTDTYKAMSELSYTLGTMNKLLTKTDTILKQLQDSKATAIKVISDFRVEMEKFLKKLEKASVTEIEDEYKKLEAQIIEERKTYEDSIADLKSLQQLFAQAAGNIAQLFVCTKLAEKKYTTIGEDGMKKGKFIQAEVKFLPSGELKSSIEQMVHLGEASAISSQKYNKYKATKICAINVRLNDDSSNHNCSILDICIVDDTVIFTDYMHNKLKRFDISSSSLIDYCKIPENPFGVCRVGEKEVAVPCGNVVQFVSIHERLSLSRSIKMKHKCYSLAHSNGIMYITDQYRSLYMYDMSGNLLKTVTSDSCGQPLFICSNHITFNDKNDRLFVCDEKKGLVCFNARCDYIETITDPDVRPDGVCVDGYGNVIVANVGLNTIFQCDQNGQKCGIIVNQTRKRPRCVCIHHGLSKMFVGYSSDIVEVYNLTWNND